MQIRKAGGAHLDREAVHEILEALVEVRGVHRVKQVHFWLLGCTAQAHKRTVSVQ